MFQPFDTIERIFSRKNWGITPREDSTVQGLVPCPRVGELFLFQFGVTEKDEIVLTIPILSCGAERENRDELYMAILEIEVMRRNCPGAFYSRESEETGFIIPHFSIGWDKASKRSYWNMAWMVAYARRECSRAYPFLLFPAKEGRRCPLDKIAAAFLQNGGTTRH